MKHAQRHRGTEAQRHRGTEAQRHRGKNYLPTLCVWLLVIIISPQVTMGQINPNKIKQSYSFIENKGQRIYNLNGSLLNTYDFHCIIGNNEFKVLTNLLNGVYIYTIEADGMIIKTDKFIKTK